jgi:hypothetical protein
LNPIDPLDSKITTILQNLQMSDIYGELCGSFTKLA